MKRLSHWFIFLAWFPLLSFALDRPMPASDAFKLTVAQTQHEITANWTILPGYYLYRDHIKITADPADAVTFGEIQFPNGIKKHDPLLGQYQIYEHALKVTIPIQSVKSDAHIKITYQGCSTKGFCYPPLAQTVSVNADPAVSSSWGSTLGASSNFVLLLAFFGFGLLLSLTPCVLPMIPILSSIIVGQGHLKSMRAFALSLSYVMGMAIAYAIAGTLAGLAGSHLQTLLQTPLVLSVFSLLFALLALSLFGFYELRLPHFIHHHINHISSKQKSGTYVGVFIMGFLSILIVSPCVSGPLVAALSIISQKGNVFLGMLALFVMGFGMGFPLLIIGTLGGSLLPRAGRWMEMIRHAMGVVMLALAIAMVGRFLRADVTLILWGVLWVVTAVYMGAFAAATTGLEKLYKGLGLCLFIYGGCLLLSASFYNRSVALPGVGAAETTVAQSQKFTTVKNLDELNKAIAAAKGHPIIVDFYADWCTSCKHLDKNVFENPEVQQALSKVTFLRVDVTANDNDSKALEERYNVIAPPTVLFFNAEGDFEKDQTLVGDFAKEQLINIIKGL